MQILSAADQSVYQTVELQSKDKVLDIVEKSKIAQQKWKKVGLQERMRFVNLFVDHLVADKEDICTELSHLIGRFESLI
jgi:acyl-CoA reductase-like NAD-dependent aldehyde dehydrogenase